MESMKNEFTWYTIQCYGNELKIVENIKTVIAMNGIQDMVEEIVVPTRDEIEMKKGVKVITPRSVYSGYIFIKAKLTMEVQSIITAIPKISAFINDGVHPTPLAEEDINNILEKVKNRGIAQPKFNYEKGDEVTILEGAFSNFKGTVLEYNMETGVLNLEVLIFGRKTPVEMNFENVEKVEE